MFRRFALSRLFFVCAVCLAGSVHGASLAARPDIAAFIDAMHDKHGFETDYLIRLFDRLTLQTYTPPAEDAPEPDPMTWAQYKQLFLTESRIEAGAAFWRTHAALLARAEQEYGVDAAVIVAILGIETNYGRMQGNHRVIEAIASRAFNFPDRRRFFTKELEEFLLFSREENIHPLLPRGSYAGAMGIAQFIPSSYRRLAIDYDDDGVRDLMHSVADVIGSVAHYLAAHDWEKGMPIVARIDDASTVARYAVQRLKKPTVPVSRWQQRGILHDYPLTLSASVIRLSDTTGDEYWAVFHNFYAITRYNHSRLYAMAVYALGRAIAARRVPLSS